MKIELKLDLQQIDYGDGKGAGFHRTEYGDIKIKVER